MCIYFVYSIIRITTDSDRVFDIIDIILTFSYLIMLFGVTLSIKTSVDKEVRESRMQNEINLFEDEDEDCSVDSEVFSGRNSKDPLLINKLRVKKGSKL
jgi:hypothetical protein